PAAPPPSRRPAPPPAAPARPSGAEAAEALGVSPDRVFKTLVADVDGALTVAVVPVAGRLDLKALAAAVGGKRAVMADPAAAERTTGYVRGGISPLGQRKRLPTVLDASASRHETICVSAGRRGLEVELAPAHLAELTGAVLAPVARA
ncbi:Cys-tRNA(Pro) deacylase, partial [Streptomyces sp. Act-28]